MNVNLDILINEEIYNRVIKKEIPKTKYTLLIATAYTKQTTIDLVKGKRTPFIKLIDDLLRKKVNVFLLLAAKPSKVFMETLKLFPRVEERMQVRLCARNHNKVILIDNKKLYLGSANLTGAGIGSKSKNKRNFEFGIFTQNRHLIKTISDDLMKIWNYKYCEKCKTKKLCQRERKKYRDSLSGNTDIRYKHL